MAKRFYWEQEIVSIEDNIVTFKGGEQTTFSENQLKLVTDKKVETADLKNQKLQLFQAYMFEAFDTLDLTDEDFSEWIKLVMKKWDEDKGNKILQLLGIKSFNEITYRTIHK